MIAERSDHEALSGDVFFVLIGDHMFSPTELRSAYYENRVIFAADADCLSVRWSNPHNLAVMCSDGSIDPSHIGVRKRVTCRCSLDCAAALRQFTPKEVRPAELTFNYYAKDAAATTALGRSLASNVVPPTLC